ncbi:HNH endonuclease signature motif containing protein [Blastococcus sp. CT_GayMR16]|uniref:HNH endonuclease signature motif containing protein n=1 Tax=Blastococcus sp. CT_GayMR16 TaxID=2559607 RepID=UPI0010733672|nr:HNH endonuclease signature motif containing protein [Blastococcus sp. CT_GayMR16]TFV90084.1 HNH endonuclease [Blastococcus sp. CT_GayMR16]
MDDWEAAFDALASEDLDCLVAPQLLDRTSALARLANRVMSELTRTVRRCETVQAAEHDGLTSMKSWLRTHVRLSAAEITRLVRNGRALDQLPALRAAFAAGAVTAEQVSVVAPVTAVDVQAEAVGQGVDLAQIDATLTEVAVTLPHAQLGRVVAHFLARLDPDGTEPDPSEGRSLTLSKLIDGRLVIRGELDAVGGEKLQAALESIAQAHRPAGDLRTRAQQLGDGIVQLADNALAAGGLPVMRTVKPHVVVTIPLADLVDPSTGPVAAELGFGATISAGRARWLACDGSITRIVVGPEGQPLDFGRTKRVVPPQLRRAVEHRDKSCVFAGCEAPSYWCDVHHLIHWVYGGETSLENSALLCEQHHTKVHHGFSVVRQPDGRWRTWRPDGTEILMGTPLLV